MSKLIITVGLPASGKTTFSHQYTQEINNAHHLKEVNHINIDKIKGKNSKLKNLNDIVKAKFDNNCKVTILDGLFLTNTDIIKAFYAIPDENNITEIEIHYWKVNREFCLINDKYRRKQNSEITIKHAIIEKPDIEIIKTATGITDVQLIWHIIVKKSTWQDQAKELNIKISDGKYLYSNEWSLGGTCGNYEGEISYINPEESEDFKAFDRLIEKINPTMTFLQYKKLYSQCVKIDERKYYDYYGGCETCAFYKCDLEKLFKMIEEM